MALNFKERITGINRDWSLFQELKTLQVNLGNFCNQRCIHCHVNAGPFGKQIMKKEVMNDIIRFISKTPGLILDITGGCPEMNPHFRFFVDKAKECTSKIMVRSNLTVMLEEGMEWIPDYFKENRICLVCSLPCYTEDNVDKQRGEGIFEKSIKALKILNRLGYGIEDELELDLVYNPGGAFLPPLQEKLEKDYKQRLKEDFGVVFHHLFTITNAPINRFRKYLEANGKLKEYQGLLEKSFNPDTAENIMCRTLLSVDWQGILYNCDFNQALGLPLRDEKGRLLEITNLSIEEMKGTEIILDNHCYCCTAGFGSSCTGTLA
jgi:radical SAM/Cys-rich protein